MLVFRKEQLDKFRDSARRSFEAEMFEHLSGFSPRLRLMAGEEALRRTIHYGIDQAQGQGFTFRGPVRLYLELALLLGCHFDTDPQYPWAAEILATKAQCPQTLRAKRLYEAVLNYRCRVFGEEYAYLLESLRNIQALARQPPSLSAENLIAEMTRIITWVYPQKADDLGADGLTTMIQRGLAGARRQQFGTARAAALVIGLQLAFGHGCGRDPLYPWIAQTLADPNLPTPEARVQRLAKMAMAWLERRLAYVEKGTFL